MTTSLIIYRRVSHPNQLFAHCTHAKEVVTNGVAPETLVVFVAAMPKTDRETILRFAYSERRWPFELPIAWDDETS